MDVLLDGFLVFNASLDDRVLEVEVLLLVESFLANVPFLLVHANEHACVLGLAEHHGNLEFGSIVIAEARFHGASANVDHNSLVVVFHFG